MKQACLLHLFSAVTFGLLFSSETVGEESIFSDKAADARMARAIAIYKRIESFGGWPRIAPGRTLRFGATDDRVSRLRIRLAASGDLREDQRVRRIFDRQVERAVRLFQARHGLLVDGIVGPETLAALNVPADRRHEILSINRKRLNSWQTHISGAGVVVNVPDASLELLENGRAVLRSRAVVGRPDWPTPALHSEIFAIDVNPIWYVPARIAREELLPRARRDPEYLKNSKIRVFAAEPNGRQPREVAYRDIDFEGAAQVGYRLRQDAGPDNALGVVKFVFDNPHSVYLHDTPVKEAFDRTRRSLSHGCVRIAAAMDLAKRLAAKDPKLDPEALEAAIETGKSLRLTLSRTVPIHIVYLTAWVDRKGLAQFRRDIYQHDRRDRGAADPARAACGGA